MQRKQPKYRGLRKVHVLTPLLLPPSGLGGEAPLLELVLLVSDEDAAAIASIPAEVIDYDAAVRVLDHTSQRLFDVVRFDELGPVAALVAAAPSGER